MRRSRATLRKPEEKDLPLVIDVSREFHEASWFSYTQFSYSRIADLFFACVETGPDKFGEVAVNEADQCVGFFTGGAQEHYWSNTRMAVDLAFYIQPEYRTFRLAKDMIESFENWAQHIAGCQSIMLGVTAGLQPEKTARLYAKLGYGDRYYGLRKSFT